MVLLDHLNNIEDLLVAYHTVSKNFQHPTNKGTAREKFIQEFLQGHLGQNALIGKGEIINSKSELTESRNEFDIIIYKFNYPKINVATGLDVFLAESVLGTIEVKSILDKEGLKQAIMAARRVKDMKKSITIPPLILGYLPSNILNFVVAYEGPANMDTVDNWKNEIYNELHIEDNQTFSSDEERIKNQSKSIDVIVILKKGFIYYDNTPLTLKGAFRNNEALLEKDKSINMQWVMSKKETGNLTLLFAKLVEMTSTLHGSWLNPLPYLNALSDD